MGLDLVDLVLAFAGIMLLLSVVVTAIVEILGTVLNLRGWVLLHGIKTIVSQVAPGLRGKTALTVAGMVLQHPTVTHQFLGRNAVAIRKDELLRLLEDVVAAPATLPNMKRRGAIEDFQKRIEETGSQLRARVDAWFDTVMDRSSALFSSWTQLLTILTAAMLVWAWNIDALQIFQSLRVNKEVRQHWANQSQRIANEASAALAQRGQAEALVTAALLDARKELTRTRPDAEADIARLANPPGNLDTRDKGEAWIAGVVSPANRDRVLESFGIAHAELSTGAVRQLQAQVAQAQATLTDMQTGILGTPPRMVERKVFDVSLRIPEPRALSGMLLAWLLLSLGAPFWFNLLKSVSSLRPTLAGRVERTPGSS